MTRRHGPAHRQFGIGPKDKLQPDGTIAPDLFPGTSEENAFGNVTATEIDFNPIAGIAATDVQGAIEEVNGDLATHEADTHGYIVATWSFPGPLTAPILGANSFPIPDNSTFYKCQISCTVAPTGANGVTVDVNYHAADPTAATTIYTTGPGTNRPVIPASGFTDVGGTPDVTGFDAGGFLLCDLDTVGGTIAGSHLVVSVWMTVD
jgi:hypothetical protein